MSRLGRARPFGRADIHIHIGRLVIDRAAFADTSARGLHDEVMNRIAHRLDAGAEVDSSADRKPGLSDAIAAAVTEHISPRLPVARRR